MRLANLADAAAYLAGHKRDYNDRKGFNSTTEKMEVSVRNCELRLAPACRQAMQRNYETMSQYHTIITCSTCAGNEACDRKLFQSHRRGRSEACKTILLLLVCFVEFFVDTRVVDQMRMFCKLQR